MPIRVVCVCGQPFTVGDGVSFPRILSCHVCGLRLRLDGPDSVSLLTTDDAVQTAPSAPQARPADGPRRRTDCPDCGGALEPVKLFARGPENPLSGLAIDTEVNRIAEVDAPRGWFVGMFQASGHVSAWMCVRCGRILMYGSRR